MAVLIKPLLTLFIFSAAAVQEAAPSPGEEQAEQRRYTEAVAAVAQALTEGERERFQSLFSEVTKGMQPNELWRYGHGVLRRFGAVQEVAFGEKDGDGAFVKVRFERAEREFYVRLRGGKIHELTYVPPPPHP